MNYTIVAYKEDGVDTCRGCVMDRWGSGFEIRVTSDRREVPQLMSEFVYANMDTGRSDGSWEINILFNGIPSDDYGCRHRNLFYKFISRAEKIASARRKVYLTKQAAEKSAQEEAARQRKVQQDLETLNRLKAQYETNGETP